MRAICEKYASKLHLFIDVFTMKFWGNVVQWVTTQGGTVDGGSKRRSNRLRKIVTILDSDKDQPINA